MKPTIIEDEIFDFEPFEKDGSGLLAAEASWRGMAEELQELHYLKWHKWQVPVSLYGLTQEERDAIGYIDYHNINDNEPDDDE